MDRAVGLTTAHRTSTRFASARPRHSIIHRWPRPRPDRACISDVRAQNPQICGYLIPVFWGVSALPSRSPLQYLTPVACLHVNIAAPNYTRVELRCRCMAAQQLGGNYLHAMAAARIWPKCARARAVVNDGVRYRVVVHSHRHTDTHSRAEQSRDYINDVCVCEHANLRAQTGAH